MERCESHGNVAQQGADGSEHERIEERQRHQAPEAVDREDSVIDVFDLVSFKPFGVLEAEVRATVFSLAGRKMSPAREVPELSVTMGVLRAFAVFRGNQITNARRTHAKSCRRYSDTRSSSTGA